MSTPDLHRLVASMYAEATALRDKAAQLVADADALDGLLPRPAAREVKWIDSRSMPIGEAAVLLGNLVGGGDPARGPAEPRMYCNLEDYTRAGLQGVRSRILLAHGHGWLIPRMDIPSGRVVSA